MSRLGCACHDMDNEGGSVYVFERSGSGAWGQTDKLTASDSAPDDNFGYSVALAGIRALVGARWDDDEREDSGSGYLFQLRPGDNAWAGPRLTN